MIPSNQNMSYDDQSIEARLSKQTNNLGIKSKSQIMTKSTSQIVEPNIQKRNKLKTVKTSYSSLIKPQQNKLVSSYQLAQQQQNSSMDSSQISQNTQGDHAEIENKQDDENIYEDGNFIHDLNQSALSQKQDQFFLGLSTQDIFPKTEIIQSENAGNDCLNQSNQPDIAVYQIIQQINHEITNDKQVKVEAKIIQDDQERHKYSQDQNSAQNKNNQINQEYEIIDEYYSDAPLVLSHDIVQKPVQIFRFNQAPQNNQLEKEQQIAKVFHSPGKDTLTKDNIENNIKNQNIQIKASTYSNFEKVETTIPSILTTSGMEVLTRDFNQENIKKIKFQLKESSLSKFEYNNDDQFSQIQPKLTQGSGLLARDLQLQDVSAIKFSFKQTALSQFEHIKDNVKVILLNHGNDQLAKETQPELKIQVPKFQFKMANTSRFEKLEQNGQQTLPVILKNTGEKNLNKDISEKPKQIQHFSFKDSKKAIIEIRYDDQIQIKLQPQLKIQDSNKRKTVTFEQEERKFDQKISSIMDDLNQQLPGIDKKSLELIKKQSQKLKKGQSIKSYNSMISSFTNKTLKEHAEDAIIPVTSAIVISAAGLIISKKLIEGQKSFLGILPGVIVGVVGFLSKSMQSSSKINSELSSDDEESIESQ